MIISATQKNTRQTPRKVRLVANQVRKLSLVDAMKQLSVIEKKSTVTLLKVVRQAVANAMHNHGFAVTDLSLKNILVLPGSNYKRFRMVSRGRTHKIFKKTCHVTVELEAATDAVKTPVTTAKTPVAAEKTVEAKAEVKATIEKKTVKKVTKPTEKKAAVVKKAVAQPKKTVKADTK